MQDSARTNLGRAPLLVGGQIAEVRAMPLTCVDDFDALSPAQLQHLPAAKQ